MEDKKAVISTPIAFILFTALFALIIILLTMGIFSFAANTNSLCGVAFSLLFALPFGYWLFFYPRFSKSVKPWQRIVLPALIFPICILLGLGWNLYQQLPANLFRIFIADPIPDGVTNIQGHDISGGFDLEIVMAFDVTPEAIEEIVKENHLVLHDENTSSYILSSPPVEYFPDIHWNKDWTAYASFSIEQVNVIVLWVNPEKDTAIFHLIDG